MAQQPHKPLRQNTVKRRNEVIRFDAHVDKSADNVDNVVCVDRCKYKVTGQCRLNRDLGSFLVTNFADHYLVWIVTQDRTQSPGKGQTLLFIHWYLNYSMKLIFNRVFDGNDLVFFVSYLVQSSVKRCCFTGTGRTRNEDHSIWLFDIDAKSPQVLGIKTDHIEIKVLKALVDLLFVENTNYSILTKDGRHYRNSKVDR